MTSPGATEAVTPEQLIRKFDEGWEVFLSSQLGDLSKQIALAELAEAIRQYGREAEANALRRAVAAEDSAVESQKLAHEWMVKHDKLLGFIQKRPAMLKELIEHDRAIRSLLPKEAGK